MTKTDTTNRDILSTEQILDAQLDDWQKLNQAFHGRFRTGDFATGLRLVAAVGDAAETAGHDPDLKARISLVDVTLVSHDALYRPDDGPERVVPWVTRRDVDLARRISAIAAEQGVAAEPQAVATIEMALDTADMAAVGPFWAALLTGVSGVFAGGDVHGPRRVRACRSSRSRRPTRTRPRGRRFHLDVWLPHDVAEQRIAAAVAAGGRVVNDENAPSYTILADAEGNKACVCASFLR